jgi:hypothetical protein
LYFVPKKLPLSYQKYGFGIRDPEKPYPGYSGSWIQGHKGTGYRIPDPQQCRHSYLKMEERQAGKLKDGRERREIEG